jgi:hypothetical protein
MRMIDSQKCKKLISERRSFRGKEGFVKKFIFQCKDFFGRHTDKTLAGVDI